jgi:hypothetical protein
VKHSVKFRRINKALQLFLCSLTLLGSACSYSQDLNLALKEIKGRILENKIGISNVHIINLSAEDATISDADGFFSLPVREGDTLLISAIRYQRKTLQVSKKILESSMLEIPLEPFVNQLDEVVLWPYNLSGDLDQDLSNVPVDEPVTAASLGLPNAHAKVRTQSERKLIEATTGSGLIPLNPILNAISGRTRMLKKRLARDRAYLQTEEVRSRFSDSLFVQELRIPEIRIPDFMYFCEVDPGFSTLAKSGDRFRMWEFFRRKSLEYRKNNALE